MPVDTEAINMLPAVVNLLTKELFEYHFGWKKYSYSKAKNKIKSVYFYSARSNDSNEFYIILHYFNIITYI